MDDDEDDVLGVNMARVGETFDDVPTSAADEATKAQVTKAVVTKEQLPYACFFRFDKRFAAELWSEALAQLEKANA